MWAVIFHPEREQLISAGGDRTLRLWTTSSRNLVARLCERLPGERRDLTPDERAQYLSGFPPGAGEKPCREGEG